MDGSVLKKALSAIKDQLESARGQEVEEIDVDIPRTNFDDITGAIPKVLSLQRAIDEAVAASLARPTLASNSPISTGTTTEQVVAQSPMQQKLSNPSLIPLNTGAFQPSPILTAC